MIHIPEMTNAKHPHQSKIVSWFFSGYLSKLISEIFNLGFTEGSEQSRFIGLIDGKQPLPISADTSIYGPSRFAVTPQLIEQMRTTTQRAAQKKIISMPTEDQWEMILSDHPATCVSAGAGSGKSTTLVLRVIFMLCYLKINPKELTVVSFTKKSCEELREKIEKVASYHEWNSLLNEKITSDLKSFAYDLVRTFHSALYKLVSSQFAGIQWFEMLNDETKFVKVNDSDIDLFNSKLNPTQLNILLETYKDCFLENDEFRKSIISLIDAVIKSSSLLKNEGEPPTEWTVDQALERDRQLTLHANNALKDLNLDFEASGMKLLPYPVKIDGREFYANGYLLNQQNVGNPIPIFIGLNGAFDNKPLFKENEMLGGDQPLTIHQMLKVKRKIIQNFYDKELYVVNDTSTLKLFGLKSRFDGVSDPKEFPRINIALNGEFREVDIVEAFYAQASFIEGLGMEVPEALARATVFRRDDVEFYFSVALSHFWVAFERRLSTFKPPVMTFNRAFLNYSEHKDEINKIPRVNLLPFTHLLVDEFQDISPQIVSWLRSVQRRLQSLGSSPSVMSIGDDWQSIYGWRGSAPEIFVNFNEHFPSSPLLGDAKQCKMEENFRSISIILSDATKLLSSIKVRSFKRAISNVVTRKDDHGVLIKDKLDPNNPEVIVDEIIAQLKWIDSLNEHDKNKVMVLSRSNKMLDAVQKKLEQRGTFPGVVFNTFHRSKGLQAEVAILCGNCDYSGNHLFRNEMYRISGIFSQSYDESAKDESYRLGYVAVTRGIRRVIWFVDKPKGAAELIF